MSIEQPKIVEMFLRLRLQLQQTGFDLVAEEGAFRIFRPGTHFLFICHEMADVSSYMQGLSDSFTLSREDHDKCRDWHDLDLE